MFSSALSTSSQRAALAQVFEEKRKSDDIIENESN